MSSGELSGLLDKLERTQMQKVTAKATAAMTEDAWVTKFDARKAKVIRPALERLGAEIRKREHDFNIVEVPFRRSDNRANPIEASIRMDIYLATERTRTTIGQDRRPHLAFTTNHRTQMVQVTICDITSRGGVASKIGDFPLEKIDPQFIKDKFIALFKRLLAQNG